MHFRNYIYGFLMIKTTSSHHILLTICRFFLHKYTVVDRVKSESLNSHLNNLVVLLIRLSLFFGLLLSPPPPNDGLCLVLFAAQVVSV